MATVFDDDPNSQSALLQQAAQNSVMQSQQPTPDSIPNVGPQGQDQSQLPINQRDFSSPNAIQVSATPPIINVAPTFVPGIGMLGAGVGYTKGLEAFQNYQLNAATNQRANEQLGMDKSRLGIAKDYLKIAQGDLGLRFNAASQTTKTFEHEQEIQAGMIDASKVGGFGGVVDYLKTADPAKAITFQAAKLSLDDQIMKNEIFQSQVPNMKTQALFDAYRMGGQLSASIASAPAELREEMYQQSKPLFEKLGLDMPKTLDQKAIAMGQLMIAQGTPENIAYASQKLIPYADNEVDKINKVIDETNRSNIPNKEARLAELARQREGAISKANQTQQQAANAQLMVDKKNAVEQFKTAQNYSKSLYDASNKMGYIKSMPQMLEFQKTLAKVEENRKNGIPTGILEGQLFNAALRMNAVGSQSDNDRKALIGSAGYETVSKKIESALKGENVQLNNQELGQYYTLSRLLIKQKMEQQKALEQGWKESAEQVTYDDGKGNPVPVIKWDAVNKPSDAFNQLNPQQPVTAPAQAQGQPPAAAIQYLQQNPNAAQAFTQKYGVDANQYLQGNTNGQ